MSAGQLDQISEAIGELKGSIKGIEKYIHDKRHDDAQVAMKIDGIASLISREVARIKGEIQGQLDLMDRRVTVLETAHQQQTGAKNLAVFVLKSPLIGWLFAVGVAVAAWWKGGKL